MNLDRIRKAIRTGLDPLAAPEPLRLSEWAAEHFYLSTESSYVRQRWEAYPYQNDILDCMGNDDIEEVKFRKSARVGYTKMLLAAIGYFAEHKHRNQAVWQPTDEDSDEFVKTELDPMIRDVPAMRAIFPSFGKKHRDNTLRQRMFRGSTLHLRGGKAAKNYRRLTVSVAILDELDGFDGKIEGEGPPMALARKRVEGATFPKVIAGSTPLIKDTSMIEAEEKACDLTFIRMVPCPDCETEHELKFGDQETPFGFKWLDGDPETVRYQCAACGSLYTQAAYLSVWQRGRWVAANGTWIDRGEFRNKAGERVHAPRTVAFRIWTAYSPQTSWVAIVRQFIEATKRAKQGDTGELQGFVNLTLGESWEETGEKADKDQLQKRAEGYPLRSIPDGVMAIVTGVDVQDDRFELVSWGFGAGEEMWALDYRVIEANPADATEWDAKLWPALCEPFHGDSGDMVPAAVAIDTQGHCTHQAYNFCRQRSRESIKVFAIRGDNRYGTPVGGRASLVDVKVDGKVIRKGLRLWPVGTDTAKDLLFGRLRVTQPGPGRVHFSTGLPDDFYAQLTAEARVLQKTVKGDVYRWVKKRQRNEVLDCTVYAMFGAYKLNLHSITDPGLHALRERHMKREQPPDLRQTPPPNPAPRRVSRSGGNPFSSDSWEPL
jgi:phage terminase large subunit GpA-like protein